MTEAWVSRRRGGSASPHVPASASQAMVAFWSPPELAVGASLIENRPAFLDAVRILVDQDLGAGKRALNLIHHLV